MLWRARSSWALSFILLLLPVPAWAICEAGGASQPSVDLEYTGPDLNGNATVKVSFAFPNTNSNFQRTVELFRDGVGVGFYYPGEISGTKEFVVPFACLNGPRQLLATARACGVPQPTGFYDQATTTVTVDTTPTVSISTFGPNASGITTVSVGYEFPNTSSHLQRRIDVYRDGVHAYTANISDHSGERIFTSAGSCGATWQAVATACGQFTDVAVETAADRKPEIQSVSLLKIGIEPSTKKPIFQATVSYDLKNPNGTVRLDLENWVGADGQQHAGGLLDTILQIPGSQQPANPPSGTKVFTFTAPSESQHVSVVATATTICGTARKGAGIDCSACPGASANPVYYGDGNMRLSDGEPLPPLAGRSLARTYNSDEQVVALFGRGWTTFLDRRIIVHPAAVSVTTETNEVVRFELAGGLFRQTWPTARRELGSLTHNAGAGTYTYRAPGATEVADFRDADGRIVALRDSAGARQLAVTYDGQGRPATITDAVTEVAWNLTFDGAQRRVTAVSVVGHPELSCSYVYSDGNLTSVLAPGGATWRTYEYVADRMTASRDALGHLIESHAYDANGFAVSSTGDVDEIANIAFGLTGSVAGERVTRVTYRSGAVAEHSLRAVGNGWRPVRVTGGCASCGDHDATYVHDERGRAIREQGADGYVTVTAYAGDHVLSVTQSLAPAGCDPQTDPQHCLLGSDALATVALESTGASASTAYGHADPLWPDRVTSMTRTSVGVPGQLRREDYLYHPVTGALMRATICGWTAGGFACDERTTLTTFYEGSAAGLAPAFDPGGVFQSAWLSLPQPSYLIKSVDGPRTDVQDVSSLVHYPIDSTVPPLLRGRLAATRNAAGHITRYEAYDVFGNATRVVDPNGVAMEMTFDTLGRTVTSTTKGVPGCNTAEDPLCATDLTSTRTYATAAGPLRLEQRPGGGVTAYAYDGRGRVETVSRGPAENDLRERIETSYDPLTGKKNLERMLADEAGTWVEKQRQSFAYDSHARLQTVTHADGAAIHYTYDPEDRVASIRAENHAAPNTLYSYDPAGRLAAVQQTLAGKWGDVITTSYAYDTDGNLIAVTDPNGNVTSYLYDDFGQMTSQESPVTGTTAYAYDEAGNLTQMTDARGATTTRVYDTLNRVTSATSTMPPKSEVVSWTYDDPAAGRFAVGRLATMTDPSGSTTYHYERRGLLRDETRTLTGAQYTYTSGFRYDADGNRAVVSYPSTQLTVQYGFDYAGRPTSAGNFVTAASYLPFGPLTSLSFANGTTQTIAHDARYRVESNRLTSGPNTIAHYTYGYDAAGNITSILDATDPGYDRTFQYDDINRLVTANTGTALWRRGSYTWDAMGNMLSLKLGEIEKGAVEPGDLARPPQRRLRTEENLPLGRSTSFVYSEPTPRLLEVIASDLSRPVGYDPAGNETSYVATRTYSPRNLLAEVTDASEPEEPLLHKLTYTYDGRGIRVTRAESPADGPGTTARRYSIYTPELNLLAVTHDDASNIWTQSASDKNIHYEIVWFVGRPIAQITPAGPRLYTFTDHLGTPIFQTDATATVTWRAEYEPFGNIWELRTGTRTAQPLRFPGQEVAMNWEGQEESYNIFRWYRAGWGRYTQADPLPQPRMDLYGYALASPVRRTDRLGLFSVDPACSNCGPTPPKNHPNLGGWIKSETSVRCEWAKVAVTDAALLDCIQSKCQTAKIFCNDPEGKCQTLKGKNGVPAAAYVPMYGGDNVYVCPDNWPKPTPVGQVGAAVFHEFAHLCGWCHGDGKNIPQDPGPDGTCWKDW